MHHLMLNSFCGAGYAAVNEDIPLQLCKYDYKYLTWNQKTGR